MRRKISIPIVMRTTVIRSILLHLLDEFGAIKGFVLGHMVEEFHNGVQEHEYEPNEDGALPENQRNIEEGALLHCTKGVGEEDLFSYLAF